jgi:hypothetical protein
LVPKKCSLAISAEIDISKPIPDPIKDFAVEGRLASLPSNTVGKWPNLQKLLRVTDPDTLGPPKQGMRRPLEIVGWINQDHLLVDTIGGFPRIINPGKNEILEWKPGFGEPGHSISTSSDIVAQAQFSDCFDNEDFDEESGEVVGENRVRLCTYRPLASSDRLAMIDFPMSEELLLYTAISPDGTKVVLIMDEEILILKSSTLEEIGKLNAKDIDEWVFNVEDVLFPTNKLIIVVFGDGSLAAIDANNCDVIWYQENVSDDIQTGTTTYFGSTESLAIQKGQCLEYINVKNGEITGKSKNFLKPDEKLKFITVSQDEKYLSTVTSKADLSGFVLTKTESSKLSVWHIPAFSNKWSISGSGLSSQMPSAAVFSEDNSYLAVGCFLNTLRVLTLDGQLGARPRTQDSERPEQPITIYLVICPFCGAKNEQGILKCQKCGGDL